MKASTLLLLSAVGLGLLGVSTASAAPASGLAIGAAAESAGQRTENVWYRRWGWGPGWGYRAWGPGWGYRGWGPGWGGPGWCYYHPYRCGRW
jgi:hypothetical protein